MALDGGCRWVQLRMKEAAEVDFRRIGPEVRKCCEPYNATFIVDDHVEIAREIGAHGVHLGKMDMPAVEARHLLGPDMIIGCTANTFDDVVHICEAGADYIGCGPFRFTTTKQRLAPILGLEGYRSIIRQMRDAGIALPIVAIGGITAADIPDVMQTGVAGVALSGAVLNAGNPVQEMERIIKVIKKYQADKS